MSTCPAALGQTSVCQDPLHPDLQANVSPCLQGHLYASISNGVFRGKMEYIPFSIGIPPSMFHPNALHEIHDRYQQHLSHQQRAQTVNLSIIMSAPTPARHSITKSSFGKSERCIARGGHKGHPYPCSREQNVLSFNLKSRIRKHTLQHVTQFKIYIQNWMVNLKWSQQLFNMAIGSV